MRSPPHIEGPCETQERWSAERAVILAKHRTKVETLTGSIHALQDQINGWYGHAEEDECHDPWEEATTVVEFSGVPLEEGPLAWGLLREQVSNILPLPLSEVFNYSGAFPMFWAS